jgi:acyl-CoA reductase-like NAD-dependent aldehyde dehydrogenase
MQSVSEPASYAPRTTIGRERAPQAPAVAVDEKKAPVVDHTTLGQLDLARMVEREPLHRRRRDLDDRAHGLNPRLSRVAATAAERRLYIAGEWIETGDWLEVRSPYSGDLVGRVARAGAEETTRAIDAAERALKDPLPAHRRAEILVKVAGLLGRRHEEVARLISDEAGKPIKAARTEATRAMSTYTFSAVEARKLAGEMVPMDASQAGEGKLAFTLRVPRGIVGAISPFNFPCNLVAHKLAPALAAGCAVVLKPASATPLSALLLAELMEEAGLPPGWLSVVAGPSSEIGDVLVGDDRVAALTFTGSGDVGW